MRRRFVAVFLGFVAASALLAVYAGLGTVAQDDTWEEEEASVGGIGKPRRSLLSKKWKSRKMCPPGLDICRDEEKRKAEEIAERRTAKEALEKEEATELEELSEKVLLSRYSASCRRRSYLAPSNCYPYIQLKPRALGRVRGQRCALPLARVLSGSDYYLLLLLTAAAARRKLNATRKRLRRKL
jgi:hypothetical protein